MSELASNINSFAQDFHVHIANKIEGNFVVSALSAYVALAMVAHGAGGKTAKQMRQVLRLNDISEDETRRDFQTLIDTVNNVPNVTLKIANKLCISRDLNVKERFKGIITNVFRAEHDVTCNFGEPAKCVKDVNKWCLAKTDGKIKDLLRVEDITPLTKMIVLNAVYLKGEWKHSFAEKLTRSMPFYVDGNTSVNVPMMTTKEKFYYKRNKDLNVDYVCLPYKNEDLSMHITIPREASDLKRVEEDVKQLDDDDFTLTEILLRLPKFKVEYDVDLKEHLEKMGMNEMFSDLANFENISDMFLKVKRVKQKSFIEVNEQGSKASAVTGVQIGSRSLPTYLEVNVNRPFLYKIVYKNATIFSGRIVNPLEQDESENSREHLRSAEL